MLYSEKGEALGPSALWGCASPMGAPSGEQDGAGVSPSTPGCTRAWAMLRFLWQGQEVQDETRG